jgi:hypothetical protein
MTVPFPFVANAVLTAAQLNAITSLPTTAKTASATLTAAEAVGYRVTMTSASATTITINTAVFAAGDTVFITNLGTGTCTITAGTATVSSAGRLAMPQYSSGLLVMTATGTGLWFPSATANITGLVSDAGAVTQGTGFTATKASTGTYTVTYSTAFSVIPTLAITAQGGNRVVNIQSSPTAAAFTVAFVNLSGNVQDCGFNFIATSTI